MHSKISEKISSILIDVISNEIIQEVAQRTYEKGDVRYGLKLLAKIGEKAEDQVPIKYKKNIFYERNINYYNKFDIKILI